MDRTLFRQIPIKSDNACFYRSCSYYLYLYSDEESAEEIIDKGLIQNKNVIRNTAITREMINNNDLPELLQKKICEWVYKHHNSTVEELGYSVLDLLVDTHYSHLIDTVDKTDILDDYRERYNIFAAEKNDEIEERWGGSLDMYVVTKLFNIAIKIYQEDEKKKYKLIQQFGTEDSNKPCISLLYKNGIHYVVLLPKNIQK